MQKQENEMSPIEIQAGDGHTRHIASGEDVHLQFAQQMQPAIRSSGRPPSAMPSGC